MAHDHGHPHPSPDEHRSAVDAALEAMREQGGRITGGRRAIVAAVLDGDDHHVTADEVVARLQADNPSLAVSTVYRTLETLEQLGFVTRVDLGQGRAVYHPVDHRHHHVVCTGCGAVAQVAEEVAAPLLATAAETTGWDVRGDHLTLHGRCPECVEAS